MRSHINEAISTACDRKFINRMDKLMSKPITDEETAPVESAEEPVADLWLSTGKNKARKKKPDGTSIPKTLTLGDLNQ